MFSFSRSRRLVTESFSVLKKDKELLLFPLISGIVVFFVIATFAAPLFYLGYDMRGVPENFQGIIFYVVIFIFYLVSYSVIVFFNSGLVYCAHKRLTGGDPTFMEGIQFSLRHWQKIFSWALLSATLGVFLRIVADRAGILGKVFSLLAGTAWSMVTYLIVPILVVEDRGVRDSIKHSVELFKKTWGEQLKGELTMGIFFFFLFVIPLPFAGLAVIFTLNASVNPVISLITVIGIVFLYWIILVIISNALQAIFTAALYLYAKTGTVPAAFSTELIAHAFQKNENPQQS